MILISLVIFYQANIIPNQELLDPSGGSFFPSLVALIMLLSGVVTLVQDYKKASDEMSKLNSPGYIEEENSDLAQLNNSSTNVYIFVGIVIVLVFLIEYINFFLASFMFL